jgi:hypothetical protein
MNSRRGSFFGAPSSEFWRVEFGRIPSPEDILFDFTTHLWLYTVVLFFYDLQRINPSENEAIS